ncbi:Maf family protein [Cocleimonas sp. KMM 6892]|uniref:Maf family protein n=1 Tax=unclassified Cocleimonas TaxID=2639732 RepID=UPI002DB8DAB9|nr:MULTISPECIES: Maf family protein [unclassified Cocleimonas]MEB8432205.1 Maf family protein [Cocleimonas sp. KMM 6892]MEC4714709.1 Maf family protein [Cocleimonas sp. KMM 6895]MEC4744477.1 Maf family protein [Cocleimonas sp. KMM 6896]
MSQIILASASPRRAELLDQVGITYDIQSVDIDESVRPNESAEDLVQRLAIEKSQAVTNTDKPVLGSDTLGLINDHILVKPTDLDHSIKMLSDMSGNWHEILSAVAISYNGNTHVKLNRNRVLFREITQDEMIRYWKTGEPQDKAGSYAIQGIAAMFIQRIEGSYSGIMGLPLFETMQLLNDLGISNLETNE